MIIVRRACLILVLAFTFSVSASDEVIRLSSDARFWLLPGGNYSNWRYSGLGQINNKNAGLLELAWTFATGSMDNHAGGPLVLPPEATGLSSSTLFISTPYPNEVLAINLDTLEIIWSYSSGHNGGENCCQSTNYGISYANRRIFLQQDDLSLVSIDVRSGRAVWKTPTGFGLQGHANINAPFPVNNYVLTNVVDVNGVSVSIAAYRMSDGGLAWKASSVGSDADILFDDRTTQLGAVVGRNSSLASWGGEFPRANYRSWTFLAWDSRENLIYYGSPSDGQPDSLNQPGEKKWRSSIIARDLNTGTARWVYQMTPNNEWGYNGGNEMILVDLTIEGKKVPALIHFDKNGFSYALDRTSGQLLSAEKYDPAVNWATHINLNTGKPVRNINASRFLSENSGPITVCPAPEGAKPESPAAFSPRTGLFYLPSGHTCLVHERRSQGVRRELPTGFDTIEEQQGPMTKVIPAGVSMEDNSTYLGNIIAWDAVQGRQAWAVPEKWPVRSGVLVTGGDVVFYGTLDGYVKLVDAKTGRLLWRFRVPSGVAGNFSTWMYKGKQYVGVLTGVDPDKLDELGVTAADEYQALKKSIRAGGSLMVFSLP